MITIGLLFIPINKNLFLWETIKQRAGVSVYNGDTILQVKYQGINFKIIDVFAFVKHQNLPNFTYTLHNNILSCCTMAHVLVPVINYNYENSMDDFIGHIIQWDQDKIKKFHTKNGSNEGSQYWFNYLSSWPYSIYNTSHYPLAKQLNMLSYKKIIVLNDDKDAKANNKFDHRAIYVLNIGDDGIRVSWLDQLLAIAYDVNNI
jgi:hypothetical protein